MILPTLPDIAKADVKAWNAQGKRAARRIIDQHTGTCKNCQGLGEVLVSFLGVGPTKAPVTTKKPSTWIENEGWFLIEDSKSYPCPVCSGVRIVRLGEPPKPEARGIIRDVTERLTHRADIDDDMPSL